MRRTSVSIAGVFWFTATCGEYFSIGGVSCSKDSDSFRLQNLGV